MIAYKATSNWGGIGIVEISDEKVTSVLVNGDRKYRKTTSKIKYDENGAPYFIKYGNREYLDDYMRV